uniref:Uncharacterized protein n=1 Tax=Cacopsylla melanoneura TaxID=428564 RepID=A0A8D8Q8J8_9HEMI
MFNISDRVFPSYLRDRCPIYQSRRSSSDTSERSDHSQQCRDVTYMGGGLKNDRPKFPCDQILWVRVYTWTKNLFDEKIFDLLNDVSICYIFCIKFIGDTFNTKGVEV